MIQNLFAVALGLSLAVPVVGQEPVKRVKSITMAQVWKLDATYRDRQHGVTFRYPSVWMSVTQFGYHPPALTRAGKAPIAGFGYEEGGFPRRSESGPYSATNLEGFGIVYSADTAANAGECEARAAAVAESPTYRTVVFGGRSFSEYETGQSGMSQSVSGSLYATYMGSVCYLFETDVATGPPDARSNIAALASAQRRTINSHLLDIMKSVRIPD